MLKAERIKKLLERRELIDKKINSLRSVCKHQWEKVDWRIVPTPGTEYCYDKHTDYHCPLCLANKTESY